MNENEDITIQEAKQRYDKHHGSSAYALIRTRARAIAKEEKWTECINCGYNKHIEIAHLIPIPKFPLQTKISAVNRLDNLAALCPNCHWEFDKGKLIIKGISNIPNSKKQYFCKCGNEVSCANVSCMTCYGQNRKTIEKIISKEELEQLISSIPITNIAKKFNVSDSAVIKWCKKYDIKRPGRGYWTKHK